MMLVVVHVERADGGRRRIKRARKEMHTEQRERWEQREAVGGGIGKLTADIA